MSTDFFFKKKKNVHEEIRRFPCTYAALFRAAFSFTKYFCRSFPPYRLTRSFLIAASRPLRDSSNIGTSFRMRPMVEFP